MAERIDMSLDDIIKKDKINVRRRGSGKFANRAAAGNRGRKSINVKKIGARSRQMKAAVKKPARKLPDTWTHDKFVGEVKQSSTLMISNLDFGVSDQDIRELFSEFGPLKKAAVHYDSSGRSLGKAEVIFFKSIDAIRAMKKYNGVPLDGRSMNIQTVVNATNKSSIISRIGAAAGGGGGGQQRKFGGNKPQRGRGGRTGGLRGRGGRGGGGQRGQRTGPRKNLTAEELDADLDAYTNKN